MARLMNAPRSIRAGAPINNNNNNNNALVT